MDDMIPTLDLTGDVNENWIRTVNRKRLAGEPMQFDAAFDEAEHPRDKDGRFATKGGASVGGPSAAARSEFERGVKVGGTEAGLMAASIAHDQGRVPRQFLKRFWAREQAVRAALADGYDIDAEPEFPGYGNMPDDAITPSANLDQSTAAIAERAGVTEKFARMVTLNWEGNSLLDSSVMLQRAAGEMIGQPYTGPTGIGPGVPTWGDTRATLEPIPPEFSRYAAATYQNTQDYLARLGIGPDDEITLYRGVRPSDHIYTIDTLGSAHYYVENGGWLPEGTSRDEALRLLGDPSAAMMSDSPLHALLGQLEEHAGTDPASLAAWRRAVETNYQDRLTQASAKYPLAHATPDDLGRTVPTASNPLSSWGLTAEIAAYFAKSGPTAVGAVVSIRARARDIFSFAPTGPGSTLEYEVVVLGAGRLETRLAAVIESSREIGAGASLGGNTIIYADVKRQWRGDRRALGVRT